MKTEYQGFFILYETAETESSSSSVQAAEMDNKACIINHTRTFTANDQHSVC